MNRSREGFYTGLGIAFPVFFLLHWNGMFSHTYYLVLEVMYGPQQAGSHPIAAFISAVVIFSFIALVYEVVRRLRRRNH